uniref:Na_H_Exchanger domain-containing protein n=1 Tax=Strongyloides papillosus TaxID=174720 RepID=A0A0N5BSU2_STREA
MVTISPIDKNNLGDLKKSSPRSDKKSDKEGRKCSKFRNGVSLTSKGETNTEDHCKKNPDSLGIQNGKLLFIEFSWMYFDLIVIGQILLSISFIMCGFLYFILGSTFSEVMGLVLLFFYLLLPTIPAYKSMANSNTYSGIYAYCFIQLSEILENIFLLTTMIFSSEVLEVTTVKRCYLIGLLLFYQLISVIIVTTRPFKRVSKGTLKRLFGTSDEVELLNVGGKTHKAV